MTENVWIKNYNEWIDEVLIHRFGGLEARFGIQYSADSSKTALIFFQDFEGYGAAGSDYEVKGNINTVKQLVENTINYFDNKQNVSLDGINDYLSLQTQEDIWIKNNDKQSPSEQDETLKHTFGNTTVTFGIKHPVSNENPETNITVGIKTACWDYNVRGNIDTVKMIINNTVNDFNQEKDINSLLFLGHLASQIRELNQEAEIKNPQDLTIQLAKKAGYIQGVCECVAAIGDDYFIGKKLLSEMNVNKDMAKKYANPETFKALEQGIFAPQQKLEQNNPDDYIPPKIIGRKENAAGAYLNDYDPGNLANPAAAPKAGTFYRVYANGIAFQKSTLTFDSEIKRFFLEVHADDIAKGKNNMPEYQTFEFDRAFKLEDGVKQIFAGQLLDDITRDLTVLAQRKNESQYDKIIKLPGGSTTYEAVYGHQIKMGLSKHDFFDNSGGLAAKLGNKLHDQNEGRIDDKITFQTFNYDNHKTASKTYVLQVTGLPGSENKADVFQFSKPFTHYEARDFIHDWKRAQKTENIFGKTYDGLLKEQEQQYKPIKGRR